MSVTKIVDKAKAERLATFFSQIQALLGKGVTLSIDDNSDWEEIKDFLTHCEGLRFDKFSTQDDLSMKISVENQTSYCHVLMAESHDCCGKAYLYNFGQHVERLDGTLLKICKLLAEHLGYSYLGYCHVTKNNWIKSGLKLGFSEAVRFKNKRTDNELSEMFKILE